MVILTIHNRFRNQFFGCISLLFSVIDNSNFPHLPGAGRLPSRLSACITVLAGSVMSGGAFRATAPALRRFRRLTGGLARKGPTLHAKHGPRFYYKGNRTRSMGQHTRKGGYVVDYHNKVPVLMMPDTLDTELRPYVSASTPKIKVPPPPMED